MMIVKSTDQSRPAATNKFQRRYYQNWSSFWNDLKFLISNRAQINTARSSSMLNPAFRERLMLAVTEVNLCRYCRTFHVGQARQAGVPIEEIATYLTGTIPDEVPREQKLAVCYARHWAETDNQPDPDYVEQVKGTYGDEGFQTISMVLRMIRMGNLLGNTWDYFLFRVSFGNWANKTP